MTVVVGIDPGWKVTTDSAVALVVGGGDAWRTLAVAPSFGAFVGSVGATLDAVLERAAALAGARVDVVAADMPLATVPLVARRASDDLVSRKFGAAGCAVHSPTPERPGPLADAYRVAFERCGLPLATATTAPGTVPASIEVYPHPALLTLLDRPRRVPYKVGRARSYWDDKPSPAERRARLLREWRLILTALESHIGSSPLVLPDAPRPREMKALEDQVDALICAWVGVRYVQGRVLGLGDATCAIWCPT